MATPKAKARTTRARKVRQRSVRPASWHRAKVRAIGMLRRSPIGMDRAKIADVVALVRSVGGALIGAYSEPLGARPLMMLASLPLSAVQPTPFQRDLSLKH